MAYVRWLPGSSDGHGQTSPLVFLKVNHSARMPISGAIFLAISVFHDAAALRDRSLWGQLALTGLFNIGLFQIYLIVGIATLEPSRTPIIT